MGANAGVAAAPARAPASRVPARAAPRRRRRRRRGAGVAARRRGAGSPFGLGAASRRLGAGRLEQASLAPGGSSSSRSLITLSGRKCSFCWNRIHRRRVEVVGVELPVPRRGALGVDEPLALEEADLRDRDVGELVAELREHLADREVAVVAGRHACLPTLMRAGRPTRNTQHEAADLEVGEVVQRRGVDALVVDVGAVERARRRAPRSRRRPARTDAWRRDTVMSSRKMSESGWRPSAVTSRSSTNRLPALGPRRTTSMPMPSGSSASAVAEVLVELQALGELGEAQRRFVLVGQRPAARRAEVGAGLVLVAAPAASHADEATPSTATIAASRDGRPRGRARGSHVNSTSRVERKPSTTAAATIRGVGGGAQLRRG